MVHPIHFEEADLHRLRWGDVKGTGKKQLVVGPLQGRGTKAPNWGAGRGSASSVYDVPEKPERFRALAGRNRGVIAAHDP